MRFIKLSQKEIAKIVSMNVPAVSSKDRDEMAIPSYLHKNPLIPYLMWKRYRMIAALLPQEKSSAILEFGCGVGLFLPTLAEMADKVYALDIFTEFARTLAGKYSLKIGFVNTLSDIGDNALDAIIAADVLEHVDDVDICIKQFKNKLRSGGRLIVSGPTENLLYKIGRLVAGFGEKDDYHHTNIDNIQSVIEQNGFVKDTVIKLPFAFMPVLFKVIGFSKP